MATMFGFCKSDPSIPIEHLDYKYVETCQDSNKLQSILQILRSGEEGKYPALEEFTEKVLAKRKPKSSLLESLSKEKHLHELPEEEKSNVLKEIDEFTVMKSEFVGDVRHDIPPIRSNNIIDNTINSKQKKLSSQPVSSLPYTKHPIPRSYDEWSNLEKEIENESDVCTENTSSKAKIHSNKLDVGKILEKEDIHNLKNRSSELQILAAQNEKLKGNEAFRCGDYKEALAYYNRSLELQALPAVYNNRAITFIKLEKYQDALLDCNLVLKEDPKNLKAYLRRGISNEALHRYNEARADYQKVLEGEPRNKRALELLSKISKKLEDTSGKKGKRLKVEEINSIEDNTLNICNNIEEATDIHKVEENKSSKDTKSIDSSCIYENLNDGYNKKEHTKTHDRIDDNQKHLEESIAINNEDSIITNISVGIPSDVGKFNEQIKENTIETKSYKNESNESLIKTFSQTENQENTMNFDLKSVNDVKSSTPVEFTTFEPTKNCMKEVPKSVINSKDEANKLYYAGNYSEAVKKYTSAIKCLSEDSIGYEQPLATLLCNRAMCYLKVGYCKECIDDCNRSIELSPTLKAFMRRAAAFEALEKYADAYADYEISHQMDQKVGNEPMSRIATTLRNEHGPSWRKVLPVRKEINVILSNTITEPSNNKNSEEDKPAHSIKSNQSNEVDNSNMNESTTSINVSMSFNEIKEKGNTSFKEGDIRQAIESYSQCILLRSQEAASYTNRALCYLKLGENLTEAISDCKIALELEPYNVKAFFRKALAYKALKNYKEALSEFAALLKLEPTNSSAIKEMEICKELYRKALREMQSNTETNKGESKGKRINIEEVASLNAEKCTIVKNDKNFIPKVNQPNSKQLKKMSGFEFLQEWNSIKNCKSSDYAELLKQIDVAKLPDLLSNKLDGDILQQFIRTVHDHFTSKDSFKFGVQLMKHLSRTSRFVTILLFLNTSDKTLLKTTIDLLETRAKSTDDKTLKQDINNLRITYRCL